jgi:hypothetical protein
MQQLKRTVVVTAAGGAGGGVSADRDLAVNGDFETGKHFWLDYICRCSWSLF